MAVLLVSLAAPACGGSGDGGNDGGAASEPTAPVPSRLVDGRVVVDVTIAGRSFPMILATGGRTVVPERLAGKGGGARSRPEGDARLGAARRALETARARSLGAVPAGLGAFVRIPNGELAATA
jgi:hypothetical protein